MARPQILLGDPAFSSPRAKLLHSLGTSEDGLTGHDAHARLQRYGPNTPASKSKVT